jgi:hypothetical protein
MKVTLVVPDPPPTRETPGRAADSRSPNAQPLARAGRALVASDPATFPLRFEELTVVFGRTIPDVDPLGYRPEHSIIEVLSDAGAVIETDRGYSSWSSQDPSADFYIVTFDTESTVE